MQTFMHLEPNDIRRNSPFFKVSLSRLHYSILQHLCEEISDNFVLSARKRDLRDDHLTMDQNPFVFLTLMRTNAT